MMGYVVCEGGKQTFLFHEVEVPKAKTGALVAKVLYANICGSDMFDYVEESLEVGWGLGHEFVCEIIDIGDGVETDSNGKPVAVGDRIVCCYFVTCMKCEHCLKGDFQNCENAYKYRPDKIAWDEWPHFVGAYGSHYYIRPDVIFYKVPDELPSEWVAGINCAFSQVYGGLEKQLDLREGETFLIQGAGGLGIYAACIAAEKGAIPIVIDGVKERLDMIKRFGAAHIIDLNEYPDKKDRVKRTLELTGGKGVDKAIELCGFADSFQEGLEHLKVTGDYCVIGISRIFRESRSVYPGLITRKALTIKGVVRYDPAFLKKSLDFMVRFKDKYPFGELCDKPYPMKEIDSVMKRVVAKEITRALLQP